MRKEKRALSVFRLECIIKEEELEQTVTQRIDKSEHEQEAHGNTQKNSKGADEEVQTARAEKNERIDEEKKRNKNIFFFYLLEALFSLLFSFLTQR